ncbi:MAG: biotin carboxylase N-terminal domain-containing protein, partial [Pseudomonadales bacterium]
FTHEGKKLLRAEGTRDKSEAFVLKQLTSELNLIITGPALELEIEGDLGIAPSTDGVTGSSVAVNREILDRVYALYLSNRATGEEPVPFSDLTLLDALLSPELREDFVKECEDVLLFDGVYDQIIANLVSIADEANSTRALSQGTVGELLDRSLKAVATQRGVPAEELEAEVQRLREHLLSWFHRLAGFPRRVDFLRAVEEWKKAIFPQLSDALRVVVTYLFERLIPSYLSTEEGKRYDGRIAPRNIGRRKDFWNRLTIAYHDLLIQEVLDLQKRKGAATHTAFIETFFQDFEEVSADLLSADPSGFPGFRVSIEDALKRGLPPCGVVTGIGEIRGEKRGYRVGAVISNVRFSAGAFDMASAEKFCQLLVECAQQRLPVVCFISSSGMQTKEGAGALFPMAAVNDRITRFVRDNDLPVIVFGFGDCTGGAQASFVTHPLVQTYYFSGTSMPFAGQIVVQENLPSTSRLSNYLSQEAGAMQGLVKHPFAPNLDEELQRIDPDIPLPAVTVEEVVDWVMEGSVAERRAIVATRGRRDVPETLERRVERVLIHARGCTAVKLIRIAQQQSIEVVLVQSDPDMDSVAVDMLGERDRVICIGGNTPDESYLNAMSVVRVGEHENVDALHPGIGFLSESSQFAELCRSHGINFIGPPVASMEAMGNKSNAINTARRLGVTVVPGSHGILTDIERAAEVAASIGYPVLIKAVHGGGGKGIQVVERPEDFHELFQRVGVEARAAFGNGDVYLEKFVQRLRHIEVQVLRDMQGNTKVLGLRDCTVQRDKQKVFEESDSTVLPPEKREVVFRYTAQLVEEVGYTGAGTVEFIYDLDANEVYFMEMNTRLQVEHPVTERVSGVDIVREQFRIAGGASIAALKVQQNGHAIEARVNAERVVLNKDGTLGFRPDPGLVTECILPNDPAIDVIAAVGAGKWVSPFYDSMIVQIIAHGRDRADATMKLKDYLGQVSIHGVCTNIPLLLRVLCDESFVSGRYDTNYLSEMLKEVDAEALQQEFEVSAGVPGSVVDAEAIRIDGSDELKVLAPSPGIFYITPSPSEPEYVSVGDFVDVRQTLGQMEAMKIFTPLSLRDFNIGDVMLYPDDQNYEVTRVNMANGQQVNPGDLLFVVRPTPPPIAA